MSPLSNLEIWLQCCEWVNPTHLFHIFVTTSWHFHDHCKCVITWTGTHINFMGYRLPASKWKNIYTIFRNAACWIVNANQIGYTHRYNIRQQLGFTALCTTHKVNPRTSLPQVKGIVNEVLLPHVACHMNLSWEQPIRWLEVGITDAVELDTAYAASMGETFYEHHFQAISASLCLDYSSVRCMWCINGTPIGITSLNGTPIGITSLQTGACPTFTEKKSLIVGLNWSHETLDLYLNRELASSVTSRLLTVDQSFAYHIYINYTECCMMYMQHLNVDVEKNQIPDFCVICSYYRPRGAVGVCHCNRRFCKLHGGQCPVCGIVFCEMCGYTCGCKQMLRTTP